MEKKNIPPAEIKLLLENEELRQRVLEYEETLNSIRNGEIDAIVVSGVDGEKIYSLNSVETTYRFIIEEMNEGAITISKEGLITYCNARFTELISEPMESLVGSYFVDYLQESEKQVFAGLLQSGSKEKIVGLITYKLKSDDSLTLQLSIGPISSDIQNGICILFFDITQLKQQEKELVHLNAALEHRVAERTAELILSVQELKVSRIAAMSMMEDSVEARNALEITNANLNKEIIVRNEVEKLLLESETKFRQTFELSPLGIVIVGFDGRFIKCNNAFSLPLGYLPEDLIGKAIDDVTFPEDRHLGRPEMVAILNGELEISNIQKRYISKAGMIIWGEVTISLVRNQQGLPMYFLAIIKDITVRIQSEERIMNQNIELKRFNRTMVDREIKMIELKKEINDYCKKLNLADKYSIPEGFKRKQEGN